VALECTQRSTLGPSNRRQAACRSRRPLGTKPGESSSRQEDSGDARACSGRCRGCEALDLELPVTFDLRTTSSICGGGDCAVRSTATGPHEAGSIPRGCPTASRPSRSPKDRADVHGGPNAASARGATTPRPTFGAASCALRTAGGQRAGRRNMTGPSRSGAHDWRSRVNLLFPALRRGVRRLVAETRTDS